MGITVSVGVLVNTGVLVGICPGVAVQDTREKMISMVRQMTFSMFLSRSEVAAQQIDLAPGVAVD